MKYTEGIITDLDINDINIALCGSIIPACTINQSLIKIQSNGLTEFWSKFYPSLDDIWIKGTNIHNTNHKGTNDQKASKSSDGYSSDDSSDSAQVMDWCEIQKRNLESSEELDMDILSGIIPKRR